MTLEYILNEPSIMENDGKLRKREYTLLLKHNMSKGHSDAHSKVRQHRADLQLIWYTNEL